MTTTTVQNDPYNWPFPQRRDLMSLQTISQQDIGATKFQTTNLRATNLSNNDIDGSKPQIQGYKYPNKESFQNRKDDIDGASPKKLIYQLNKVDYTLLNEDIKGTKPQINKFSTTRLPSNPLEPQYRLPFAEVRVATPPKFIRDQINITDIDGAKPNPKFFKERKDNIYTDIEGSKPKKLFIPKDQIDILNVKDINEFLQFKTNRIVDPLNPTYTISDDQGQKIQYGLIDGSNPRRLHPLNEKPTSYLQTKDITGAWAGTHSEKFLRRNERKDYRTINQTSDVFGSQVGSLKKGITTIRQSNPLVPQYQFPGALEEIQEKQQQKTLGTTTTKKEPQHQTAGVQPQAQEQQQQIKNQTTSSAAQSAATQILQSAPGNVTVQQSQQEPVIERRSSQQQIQMQKSNSVQQITEKPASQHEKTNGKQPTPANTKPPTPQNQQSGLGLRSQSTNKIFGNAATQPLTKVQKLDRFIQ